MTIKELQESIEADLKDLSDSGQIANLSGLRRVLPADYQPKVRFLYLRDDRKIREDASSDYFQADTCKLVMEWVLTSETGSQTDEEMLTDLLGALEKAEASRDFVGLKWFRDTFLPAQELPWTQDSENRRRILRSATEQAVVLTHQVANPNNPMHPVTAIRVNRAHPRFARKSLAQKASGQAAPRRRFQPVKIKGDALSQTVLESRR